MTNVSLSADPKLTVCDKIRSRHYLSPNISETAKNTAIVAIEDE